MVFENPNINLNWKGLEDQLNYKKKLCLSSRYNATATDSYSVYLIISYNRICEILHLSAKFVYLFFDFRDEPDPRSKILRVTY